MSQLEEIRKRLEAEEAFESSAEIGLNLLAALEAVEALLGEQDGYYVTDLYVHKNKLRQTITEALA